MNIHSIIKLIVVADECRSHGELVAEFEKLLQCYNFDYYELVRRVSDSSKFALAARLPEGWTELYALRKYKLIEPTARLLANSRGGFRWREAILALRADPHRKRMERLFQDSTRHGMTDGYVFPVHGRKGLLGNLNVGGQTVDLSPAEMTMFEAAAKKMLWRLLELSGQHIELDAPSPVDTTMTRREMDVIAHLADGLTSNEIAEILSISNHTVDWYINGIQRKLKARNRQHVVALCFRYGLVS